MDQIRKPRGEARLASITYSQIAEWTGLSLHTVRSYAQRGIIDTDSVETVLQWVNARRQAKGQTLIGQPENNAEVDTLENGKQDLTPIIPTVCDSGYNSRTGEFDT